MRILIASLISLCCFMAAAVVAETRVAFVLGNSSYRHVEPLKNPRNDALDLTVALEGLGFDVLMGSDYSQQNIRDAIERFAETAETADVALFFYAGHGFQVGGQNYLVPTDARITSPEDLQTQTVPLAHVVEALERSQGLKLVFLDACRDNPFGTAVEDLPGVGSGLARVGTSADFMFAYATQPDNVAYDGTGRNSFFTQALLDHIYTPGQDVSELMIAVRRDVLAATGGRQIPWDNSSLTRAFQFDRNPVTVSEETMLWQVAIEAKNDALMELYIDRYPQGAHAGDVLAYLQTGSRTRALGIQDEEAEAERLWSLARRSRMRPLLEFYLERYPDGARREEVRRLLDLLPRAEDSTPEAICERLATHPRDATASVPGVAFDQLAQNTLAAIQACSAATVQSPDLPHYTALLARATAASGDIARAVQLYRSAAEQGDLRAMVSLAQLTESGNGIPQDYQAAMALYERAAEAGSPDAMINLAVSLFQGDRGKTDPERAISLLRRAADLGSAKAVFNLGVLAQDGVIDTPDAALDYFLRAARDGEHEGYRAAAILLDEGRGVARDAGQAANLLLRGVAEDRGTLLQQLTKATGDWSPDTIKAIQSRLQMAGIYTGTVDGLSGPGFSAALTRWRNGGFKAEVLVAN
ncbi:caspase family protein [Ruegeria marina]|uniref:Sel1 repeat-containing protein n=1 Tax=Ruegeria marina TaxID=639004 RepID=A0A1G7E3V2_9RHOB|nr:caspase family protein [Ruegeria marina]SDE58136.1 Sel1 repeat-containing protein [Ruegeria marina]